MTTPSRIVVGVDGSVSSTDALRWDAQQAVLTHVSLEAVIGWQCPTQYGQDFYQAAFHWPELAGTTLTTVIEKVAADGTPVACSRTVIEGHPAEVLVAASAGADLLVVGSRGHGGFAAMLLGSVSEHVIAYAGCPVVVVRHR